MKKKQKRIEIFQVAEKRVVSKLSKLLIVNYGRINWRLMKIVSKFQGLQISEIFSEEYAVKKSSGPRGLTVSKD